MKEIIDITKDIIDNINYKDIIAVTIAEGGAMGEPNGFYMVDNKLNAYHINLVFDDQTIVKMVMDKIELCKIFNCCIEEVTSLEDDWKWFNMGFGNYLIIRDYLYDEYNKYIKNNLGKDFEHGELYQKWREILNNIYKVNNK